MLADVTVERDARILDEMVRVHGLQRRSYRRFLCWIAIVFTGVASSVVKRVIDLGEAGDRIGFVAVLTLAAVLLGVYEARDARALNTRIGTLCRELRSLALRH